LIVTVTLDFSKLCTHGRKNCLECDVRLLSVCGALDDAELGALESLAKSCVFEPKQTLFVEGEPAESVFTVTQGMIRLFKLVPDGRRQIVGFALPGDFLGLAMANQYGFSAESIVPTRVCRFSRAAFSAFVDQKPHLLRRLHEFATHELSLAQDQMVLLGRRNAEGKLAAFLIGLRNRIAAIAGHSVTVALPMSRQDIADFLGLTIETVSRTLSSMAKDKLILIVPDGVRLLNPKAVEALAEV
jgi:CRP/FNR family transcriptional regulator